MSRSTLSLVLLAIGASVFYFFFIDQWSAMKLTRADYNAANFAIDELEELAAKTDELRNEYNNISAASLDKVERMIPKGGGTANFIADLELMAARNGMRLNSMDFGAPANTGGVLEAAENAGTGNEFNVRRGVFTLPLSIQVSGGYDAFRRLIADLEFQERLIDVSVVNFAASEKDDAAFSIRANIYYQ
ncbi:MAG: hypothetical protein UY75_C0009G0007 [Parcubacteria group bacterium GW2011_GWC2_52_8c]|nr:MAG: hypothetical protein UY75_C0009G0007 [Parcubacteria group bacterium GW2011_GWC2_52_8c]